MAIEAKKIASRVARQRFLCNTPSEHCDGSMTKCSSGLGKAIKTHESPAKAFECHAKYLVEVEGMIKVGNREFSPPPTPDNPYGGPIRVLTKKCRFGARLRGGKEGRSMPYDFVGGVLVSS